jgi:hypothetical protein
MMESLNCVFDRACSVSIDPNVEVFDYSDLAFPDPSVSDPLSEVRLGKSLEEDSGRAEKRRKK